MALQPAATAVPDPGERLVLVGADGAGFDACAGSGAVSGLAPRGDGYLSVRIAPALGARAKDRIVNGTEVALCDIEGDWIGVVYQQRSDPPQDCGTGTPSPYLGAYRGPCRFGWVHSRFVTFIAG